MLRSEHCGPARILPIHCMLRRYYRECEQIKTNLHHPIEKNQVLCRVHGNVVGRDALLMRTFQYLFKNRLLQMCMTWCLGGVGAFSAMTAMVKKPTFWSRGRTSFYALHPKAMSERLQAHISSDSIQTRIVEMVKTVFKCKSNNLASRVSS